MSEQSPPEDFPHPYLAVDLVLLTGTAGRLAVSLLERTDAEPTGWVLPGAFVAVDEDVTATAERIARDKLEMRRLPRLDALPPFGAVDRDPRRRVVSLPYLGLARRLPTARRGPSERATGMIERRGARWQAVIAGRPVHLAFDHATILAAALDRLAGQVREGDLEVLRHLLPVRFPLRLLQRLHDQVLDVDSNKDSFRRRVLDRGLVEDTGEPETSVAHRPANLYRFVRGGRR